MLIVRLPDGLRRERARLLAAYIVARIAKERHEREGRVPPVAAYEAYHRTRSALEQFDQRHGVDPADW